MDKSQKIVGCTLLLLVMFASVMSAGCLRDFEDNSQLEISNVDISSEKIRSSYVDLNITTEIKSNFADSDNVSLLLKVYDKETGFLDMQRDVFIGSVENGETVFIPLEISLLKEGGYRMEVQLLEDDQKKRSRQLEISNLDSLTPDVADIGIEIGDVDFIVKGVVDNKVELQADIYLSNEGRALSDDYRVLIKARERDASLLADKAWTNTGSILPETTKIVSVGMTVPKDYNYIVDVIIWDKDTIIKRGESEIQLSPETVLDKDTVVQKKVINAEDFEERFVDEVPEEEYADETPGFTILFALVSILVVAFIHRRR
ncbi:MAG: PGF-CTERM sorting domain-containing protein [Methanococcoides sp.]|nr:PGF-CTERM sorting domain-containing protein [Methanococcoides sp.]